MPNFRSLMRSLSPLEFKARKRAVLALKEPTYLDSCLGDIKKRRYLKSPASLG